MNQSHHPTAADREKRKGLPFKSLLLQVQWGRLTWRGTFTSNFRAPSLSNPAYHTHAGFLSISYPMKNSSPAGSMHSVAVSGRSTMNAPRGA